MNIESVVDEFISAAKHEREAIINREPNNEFSWSCLEFMREAAKKSVILKSKDLLIKGLYANVIEGVNYDMRDNLTRLTLLYHSAMILGLNPKDVFQKVADNTDGKGKDMIVSYLNRSPDLKTLKCMGYRTTTFPEFDYVSDRIDYDYSQGSIYSEETDRRLMNINN